ncbi:hypothetical protein QFC19_006641 [Naganishia cerealis]|uniref:Uncharacterized protein n=1 Tax=Naganishia cerealis TaxID=610337 RepID=A0ACC2VFH2_9TREE|nr:hypothetical protein QFC19_006641 [Naganishia cerealis]
MSAAAPHFRPVQHLHAHAKAPTAARYSPAGDLLATAGADGVVHLWSTASSTHSGETHHLRSLRGHHTAGINDLCFSSNGLYLATASDDGTAVVWSVAKGLPLRVFAGHTAHVMCLAFHPKANVLATGGWDESVIFWNVLKGTRIKTLQAHSDPVSCLGYNHDGTMLVTGSYDGLMRIWDATTGQCLKTIEDEQNAPMYVPPLMYTTYQLIPTIHQITRLIHSKWALHHLRLPLLHHQNMELPHLQGDEDVHGAQGGQVWVHGRSDGSDGWG